MSGDLLPYLELVYENTASSSNGGPIHDSSPPGFPRFAELPAEIRLDIWHFALPRRILPVTDSLPVPFAKFDRGPPALAYTCRESRAVALKHGRVWDYTKKPGYMDWTAQEISKTWFDTSCDTLLVDHYHTSCWAVFADHPALQNSIMQTSKHVGVIMVDFVEFSEHRVSPKFWEFYLGYLESRPRVIFLDAVRDVFAVERPGVTDAATIALYDLDDYDSQMKDLELRRGGKWAWDLRPQQPWQRLWDRCSDGSSNNGTDKVVLAWLQEEWLNFNKSRLLPDDAPSEAIDAVKKAVLEGMPQLETMGAIYSVHRRPSNVRE